MGKKKRKRSAAKRRIDRAGLLIVALALAVRLIYLYQAGDSPSFSILIIDSQSYDAHARQLAFEGTLTTRIFWQGICYPLWLAVVYLFTNGSIVGAKIVQALIGSLLCWAVYRLSANIFDRRTGIVAGAITACYGPLVFFEGELLATGLAAVWSILLIATLLRAKKSGGAPIYAAVGLVGGFAVITRATFIPFLVAAVVWLAWIGLKGSLPRRRVAAFLATTVAGFLLVAIPVSMLSYAKVGLFTPLAHSGPINLYIGNNPDADETIMVRPGAEWRELTRTPMVEGSRTDLEDRGYFSKLFFDYIREQPGGYVLGLLSKTTQYLSSRELPRNVDVYTGRYYSSILSILTWKAGRFGFPFGVLLPLAIVGFLLHRRRIPAPFYLYLLLYPASIILVFAAARYRAATVPVLAILAAAGALGLIELFRHGNRRLAAAMAGLAAALAIITSIAGPFAVEKHDYLAEQHRLVGLELMRRRRMPEAVASLNESLRLDPENGDVHKFLGIIASEKRMHDRARLHFGKALEKNPDSYLIRYYLGVTLLNLGEREEATTVLEEALRGAREHREEKLIGIIERMLPPSED